MSLDAIEIPRRAYSDSPEVHRKMYNMTTEALIALHRAKLDQGKLHTPKWRESNFVVDAILNQYGEYLKK
jgi:hypothetical protein